ncbi:palindromic element RPE5 domain-containing protein [Rickettsia hoogstraalii]|nr:palindromic element RPE5 domain-containing protein [Rickettsia hoogstraalii]MCX4083347.1 palindromic element RPE5 domain-containing protein [Rickettsia hoogstraalii]
MNLDSYFILSFSNYTYELYEDQLGKESNESISRGAERIINIQYSRTYKDEIVNFSSSILVYK